MHMQHTVDAAAIVFCLKMYCVTVSWYAKMMIIQDYGENTNRDRYAYTQSEREHHMCVASEPFSSHRNRVRLQQIIIKIAVQNTSAK